MADEQELKQEYAEAGVDLPELKEEPKVEEPPKEEPKPEESKEPLQDEQPKEAEKPVKPRTIYDDYKDKKLEAKSATERAEQAEQERDQLAEKLRLATEGKGEDIEAGDDAVAYAQKVGADPALVKRIIEDARKGFKPETDENLKKDLEDFKVWREQNSKVIEQQMFNDEFEKTVPTLKRLFPTIDDESMKAVRGELDKLSHTKEWHDKPLDFIAFKNEETLSALISPKKRGMESKGRQDDEAPSHEVDLTADYSKLSSKEKEAFEAAYKKATTTDGLLTDEKGRKSIL